MESNAGKSTIGKRIKELRDACDITQEDLSKALFVKRETVNHWENGTRDLKTEYTVKLADYFGVTCDYILRGVEAENVGVNLKTGLCEDAINILKRLVDGINKYNPNEESGESEENKYTMIKNSSDLNVLNYLLSEREGKIFFSSLSDYLNCDYEFADERQREYTPIRDKVTGVGKPLKANKLDVIQLEATKNLIPGLKADFKAWINKEGISLPKISGMMWEYRGLGDSIGGERNENA